MGDPAAMNGESGPEPRRLRSEDSPAGRLLRRADGAYREGLAEGSAWRRFESRNTGNYWALAAAAATCCLLLIALSVRSQRGIRSVESAPVAVMPERLPVRPPVSELSNPPTAPTASPLPAPAIHRAFGARLLRAAVAVAPEQVTDATCRGLASAGKLEDAVVCFEALGKGAGLKAEVALYEAARLSGERLHDARRAIELLDQHRFRFAESALRGEVGWLRVRSLERVGKYDEALSASEELLATPAGRPLASRLHLLRGQIYGARHKDCGLAVREYVALLGEAGPAGDEAEFERAQCLERLSRPSEALAAYRRYLERADARRAVAARGRIRHS